MGSREPTGTNAVIGRWPIEPPVEISTPRDWTAVTCQALPVLVLSSIAWGRRRSHANSRATWAANALATRRVRVVRRRFCSARIRSVGPTDAATKLTSLRIQVGGRGSALNPRNVTASAPCRATAMSCGVPKATVVGLVTGTGTWGAGVEFIAHR